jgi:hypothetical protein
MLVDGARDWISSYFDGASKGLEISEKKWECLGARGDMCTICEQSLLGSVE